MSVSIAVRCPRLHELAALGMSVLSDRLWKRSHAVSDLQEGALMAAYRMFPPVGPDRADELAAGDTSVGFGPYGERQAYFPTGYN
jgi:hypothetical protein